MFLGLDITHVPGDVKHLSEKALGWTMQIEKALESTEAIDIAKLIPEGEVMRESLIAICETAIGGCKALSAIADNAGVKARLQRLGSDIVAIQHSSENHSISFYITCFEIVLRDIFGKQ